MKYFAIVLIALSFGFATQLSAYEEPEPPTFDLPFWKMNEMREINGFNVTLLSIDGILDNTPQGCNVIPFADQTGLVDYLSNGGGLGYFVAPALQLSPGVECSSYHVKFKVEAKAATNSSCTPRVSYPGTKLPAEVGSTLKITRGAWGSAALSMYCPATSSYDPKKDRVISRPARTVPLVDVGAFEPVY